MDKVLLSEEEFKKSFIAKNVNRSIENAKKRGVIPLKSSKYLSRIMGHIYGDGSLKGTVTHVRFYGNKQKLEEIAKIFEIIFHIKAQIIEREDKTGHKIDLPDCLSARCLYLIGAPKGEKVLKEFFVPSWIMNGSIEIKRNFLQAILDDELEGVLKDKNRKNTWKGLKLKMSKKIEYSESMKLFLEQIKLLLDEFGIETGDVGTYENQKFKRKDGNITMPHFFRIKCNYENRRNFFKEIGFIYSEVKSNNLYKSISVQGCRSGQTN